MATTIESIKPDQRHLVAVNGTIFPKTLTLAELVEYKRQMLAVAEHLDERNEHDDWFPVAVTAALLDGLCTGMLSISTAGVHHA